MSEAETALDAGVPVPASPTAARRITPVAAWLCAVLLALLVLHVLGVDVDGWLA